MFSFFKRKKTDKQLLLEEIDKSIRTIIISSYSFNGEISVGKILVSVWSQDPPIDVNGKNKQYLDISVPDTGITILSAFFYDRSEIIIIYQLLDGVRMSALLKTICDKIKKNSLEQEKKRLELEELKRKLVLEALDKVDWDKVDIQ